MRHSRLYGIGAGMLLCMLVLSVSSCVKDDFDRYHDVSDALSFKVEVSDGWSEAAATSSTSIRRMSQSADAEPLYLVTKVSDSAPVSAVSGAVTRGTPVENADPLKAGGFGLSAICYTGTWPADGVENNWTTNFAHDLNVTMQDGKWKASEKLEWPGSGNIKFFAYYPYSGNSGGCIAHSAADVKGAPVLTYTVPSDVKTQPDLLWAVADRSGKSTGDGTVTLNFQHALTAVTIKTGTDMLSGTITGVKFSGVYGQGICRIGGTAWTTQGSTGDFEIKDLNVALSKKTDENGIGINTTPGTTVTGGELTFMMVPQTLPEGAKLTIHFTDDLTSTDRILTADLGGTSWPSGKKVAYSINSTGIDVALNFNFSKNGVTDENPTGDIMPYSGVWYDATYTAEVQVTQVDVETKTIDIPAEKVKFYYKIDGVDTDWQAAKYPGVHENGFVAIAPQPAYVTMSGAFGNDEASGPFSLSGEKGESANCYLVDKAGYYSLPLVYGNGTSGMLTAVRSTGMLYFPKHDDEAMPANATISGAHDAVLCWQDAPDLIDPASVVLNEAKTQLLFRIRRPTLTQGNALLAVRNAAKEIIWSWHIWVTPYKNEFYNQTVNLEGTDYNLARYNLGWCDKHDHNDPRQFSLKAEIDMSAYGGATETVEIPGKFTQMEYIGSDAGDNTYYQWGRKDPMLGGIYNSNTTKYTYNNKGVVTAWDEHEFTMENKQVFNQYNDGAGCNYSFCKNPGDKIDINDIASDGVTVGYAIRHPYMFVTNSRTNVLKNGAAEGGDNPIPDYNYRSHWHKKAGNTACSAYLPSEKILFNLWDAGAENEDIKDANVTKSVYDPCPPKFKMPPYNVLKWIDDNETSFTHSGNSYVYGNIIFPLTGVRNYALRTNEWTTVKISGKTDKTFDYSSFYKISMPAFKCLTFITGATIYNKDAKNGHQLYILRVENDRYHPGTLIIDILGSSNSYGTAVRPILSSSPSATN